jgi:hypothetical protein
MAHRDPGDRLVVSRRGAATAAGVALYEGRLYDSAPPVDVWDGGTRAYERFEAARQSLEDHRRRRAVPPLPAAPPEPPQTYASGLWGTLYVSGPPGPRRVKRPRPEWGVLPTQAPVVFMHARRATGGSDRLVVIRTTWGVTGPRPWTPSCLTLDAEVVRPATASDDAVVGPAQRARLSSPRPPAEWDDVVLGNRVYAGQPDPHDPARFTIRDGPFEVSPVAAGPAPVVRVPEQRTWFDRVQATQRKSEPVSGGIAGDGGSGFFDWGGCRAGAASPRLANARGAAHAGRHHRLARAAGTRRVATVDRNIPSGRSVAAPHAARARGLVSPPPALGPHVPA